MSDSSEVTARSVRVLDGDGEPVGGIPVARLASNGTYLQGTTDEDGVWQFDDHYVGTVTILVGGPSWTAASETLEAVDWVGQRTITVNPIENGGSLIIPQSTGYVPGLNGRLNPIRDSINRNYIYADNISINDQPNQPASFKVGEDFYAEDAKGNRFILNVKEILGRTSLIQYKEVRRSPLQG